MSEREIALKELNKANETNANNVYPLSIDDIWGMDSRTDEKIVALGLAAGRNISVLREALKDTGKLQEITSLTLGPAIEHKITEAQAIALVNTVIRSQNRVAE